MRDSQYDSLLERVREGEAGAIDELLGRAMGIARRYSTAVCGRRPDREDAVQEALLQTFRHARRIREPRAFRAWLYKTVKNACLIGRRKSAATTASFGTGGAPELVDQTPPADDVLEATQARDRVRGALVSLPQSYREAVFLRDLEGLSTREVAKVLGITEANVKVRLHRAHARLRQELGTSGVS
jgi:RNA polymerase sigma-70 factor (ECF subfamily)